MKERGRAPICGRERSRLRFLAGGLAVVLAALFSAGPVFAARQPRWPLAANRAFAPVKSSIIIDARTGEVLSESNADAITYPASLTKMMTLFLTFKALDSGRLRLDQRLPVSSWAASRPPTKLALRPGQSVSVRTLILGIVTRSANDAAVVLAEGIGGSEPAFAQMMNGEARQLGMTRTHYVNASGLPDPRQRTTARDIAQLALALDHDFPREFHYFSTKEFIFRGRPVVSDDHLLSEYPGANGIKTGYIRASGFNLATSVLHGGQHLIGVVMGGRTARSRDALMVSLLDKGFAALGAGPSLAERREPQRLAAAALPPRAHPARARARVARIARTAARVAARLSPIARAEAATRSRRAQNAPRWSIELGAFANAGAAWNAGRDADSLAVVKGKPLRVFYATVAGRRRVYRAHLFNLTAWQAEKACALLHKRRMHCAVLGPARLHFASR